MFLVQGTNINKLYIKSDYLLCKYKKAFDYPDQSDGIIGSRAKTSEFIWLDFGQGISFVNESWNSKSVEMNPLTNNLNPTVKDLKLKWGEMSTLTLSVLSFLWRILKSK